MMIYRNVEIGWCLTNQEFYGAAFDQSYDRSIQQSTPTSNVRQRRAPLQRTLLRFFAAQHKLVEIHDVDPFLAAYHGNEKRLTALIP
jgi:hypothetical protein